MQLCVVAVVPLHGPGCVFGVIQESVCLALLDLARAQRHLGTAEKLAECLTSVEMVAAAAADVRCLLAFVTEICVD